MFDHLSKADLIKLLENKEKELNEKSSEFNKRAFELENEISKLNIKIEDNNKISQELTQKHLKLEVDYAESRREVEVLLKRILTLEEKKGMSIVRQFGKKTESSKTILINEAEQEASVTLEEVKIEQKEHKKVGRKVGFSMQQKFDNLDSSIERRFETIDCNDMVCPDCNGSLTDHGFVYDYKVEITSPKIIVTQIQYHRKQCECGKFVSSESNDPYPNSELTPSLASTLLHNKYVLGIPLYRMEDYYTKLGLTLSRQAMANYLMRVAGDLIPLYDLMKDELIQNQAKVIHGDETTLKVIHTTDPNRSTCYMWVYTTSYYDVPIYIYDFHESREGKHVKEFLKGYHGYIVSDGYPVYQNLENIEMAVCYAHVRRKFTDIIKALPEKSRSKSLAMKGVDICNKLFALERQFVELRLNVKEIHQRRLIESLSIVNEFETYINSVNCEQTSALGKAIAYCKNLMPNLKTFLSDGHIALSNNICERAVKPFVIARKNFLFSNTVNGAQASAINFSIIQSARSNGLDVISYLTYVLTQIHVIKIKELPDLLPWSKKMMDMFGVSMINR